MSTKVVRSMAIAMSLVASQSVLSVVPAFADATSPRIKRTEKVYSKERPDTGYFGTGQAGRLTEASSLRFQCEREMLDGNIDEALRLSAKAVQLDPGDPGTHLLYARALTAKFYSKDDIDEKMLTKCYEEWMLISRHDSDQEEQAEANVQAKRLRKLAKAMAKKKLKEQEEGREAIADANRQKNK